MFFVFALNTKVITQNKSQHQQNEAKYTQIYPPHHFSWRLLFGIALEILT